MRFTGISLQNFRNIELATLTFSDAREWIQGSNGQGKSNLLEALGLLTNVRSFRTSDLRSLIRWDCAEAVIVYAIEHETHGNTAVEIRLNKTQKVIEWDGRRQMRLSDFIGHFPTVTLSGQDLQILRGGPVLRRRFLDMALSSTSVSYLNILKTYSKILSERNALLKQRASVPELEAFDGLLVQSGVALIRARAEAIESLEILLKRIYEQIACGDELPVLRYQPDLKINQTDDFLKILGDSRERDFVLASTQRGPHRDDFRLGLEGHSAREFASEGQQRTLMLALRLAQAEYAQALCHVRPIILLDDVLGELDAQRRHLFWRAIHPDWQVFSTATQSPIDDPDCPAANWKQWMVSDGGFCRDS
jgi:DNA replication and repair protein RecF